MRNLERNMQEEEEEKEEENIKKKLMYGKILVCEWKRFHKTEENRTKDLHEWCKSLTAVLSLGFHHNRHVRINELFLWCGALQPLQQLVNTHRMVLRVYSHMVSWEICQTSLSLKSDQYSRPTKEENREWRRVERIRMTIQLRGKGSVFWFSTGMLQCTQKVALI